MYLRIVCTNNPNNWARFLSDFEFAHNFWVHTTIDTSPFEVIMGYSPWSLPDLFPWTKLSAVEQRIQKLQNIQDEARAAYQIAQQKIRDWQKGHFIPFRIGEKVWLESKNLRLQVPSQKLASKWEGPFLIKEVLGLLIYWLKLLIHWRIHNVFHADLLS